MDQDETWHAGRPRPRPHCVRWVPSPPKGAQPPIFGPCVLSPNGWMDYDATWYGYRPRPRQICVRWGPSSPPNGYSPQFSAHVYSGQTARCIKMPIGTEVRPRPRRHCVGNPVSPPLNGHTCSPQFSAHVCCDQMAGYTRILLGTEVGLGPGDIFVRWGPSFPPPNGHSPQFSACPLWPNGWMD